MPIIVLPQFRSMRYFDTVTADNPIAYYRLGESALPVTVDSSGNGHHMDYQNAPILGEPSLVPNTSDTSVSFNGTTQFAVSPSFISEFNVVHLTFEAWIHPTDLSIQRIMFHQGDFGVSNQWGWWVQLVPDGSMALGTHHIATDYAAVSATGIITAGSTYHVVITAFDNAYPNAPPDPWDTDVKFYVNGSLVTTVSAWPHPLNNAPFSVSARIGAFKGGTETLFFAGGMDEIAIYNYALTGPQIAAHYAAGAS